MDVREFLKLAEMCDKAHILSETVMRSFAMGKDFELCIPSAEAWQKRTGISVSINSLTYGHKEGLLEFWDGKDEPVGYLTADKAFELIKTEIQRRGW